MSAGGVEIELKFQLDPQRRAALERALATATAQRLPLRAVYFDTPDNRLASAAIALRLRREGERWVQTLKGRGDGLLVRIEDEVVRDGTGADAPALDLDLHDGTHAGHALRRALEGAVAPRPIYATDIERLRRVVHNGGARIEVALDVGAITAGDATLPVCEVEFELLSGPAAGLLTLAARWAERYGLVLDVTTKSERGHALALGIAMPPLARARLPAVQPGLPLVLARAEMVAASLAQALPNAAAITNGTYRPEHLHQLRVALRRLRTVLRALGPADDARDRALATLFAALGGARDADVSTLTLKPAFAAAAAAGWPTPPPAAAVAEAADGARTALRLPQAARLWLLLLALARPPAAGATRGPDPAPAVGDIAGPDHAAGAGDADEVPGADDDVADADPWDGAAFAAVARWRRQARRALADWSRLDDDGRHRVRRQLKRLRYLLEYSAPLWPAKALKRELDVLRPLQDALGRWNDLVVAHKLLAEWPDPCPAVHYAAGWLAREAAVADRRCAAAAKRWRAAKRIATAASKPSRR